MPEPSIATIRDGLAANLATIDAAQWSAYRLANATPPCGFVWVGPINWDAVMQRGGDWFTFMVTVYAALVSDIGAAKTLQKFMDPTGATSVKAALEADRTLGGAVDSLRVTDCTGEQIYALEGKGAVLGADFTVQVLT